VCEHGCRASLHEGNDGPNIRPKQLRSREAPWEGSHRSTLMSRRTERPYKADGTGKLAPHSKAPCSVPEVNGPAAQQQFTSLLREICAPGTAAPVLRGNATEGRTPGAADREVHRVGTEVSRSHSSGSHEPGHTPEGLTPREGLNGSQGFRPRRHCHRRGSRAAERIQGRRMGSMEALLTIPPDRFALRRTGSRRLLMRSEPPDADPHVRWCGGREGQSSRLPDWTNRIAYCSYLAEATQQKCSCSNTRIISSSTYLVGGCSGCPIAYCSAALRKNIMGRLHTRAKRGLDRLSDAVVPPGMFGCWAGRWRMWSLNFTLIEARSMRGRSSASVMWLRLRRSHNLRVRYYPISASQSWVTHPD
jgi:hypothetical protein